MEYVYASLILHKLGKSIDEKAIESILKAAGASVDSGRIKAIVAALEGVNIEDVLKSAVAMPMAVAAGPAPTEQAPVEDKKEEKEEKKEEEVTVGLGALFG
ncbi:MAG: 50S ribosomal protein P1 [Candidatus Lokiarchaeota archaeon]|nr:50S ribosomal protein P1 [Candidatus Lokiarchaeota archaeon]